jgi:galactonate dehydratase
MILEWQIYFHKNPMFNEIVEFDGPMVEDGFITVSDKPGVGVEINEEGMKKYAVEGIPLFE